MILTKRHIITEYMYIHCRWTTEMVATFILKRTCSNINQFNRSFTFKFWNELQKKA